MTFATSKTICSNIPRQVQWFGGLAACESSGGRQRGKGKSGGARVIYLDLIVKKRTFLVTVYGKSTKEDMTDRARAELKKVLKLIVREER